MLRGVQRELTFCVLRRRETVAAHRDRVLKIDSQNEIEERGEPEIDQEHPAAENGDWTDTNKERVAEDLDLDCPFSFFTRQSVLCERW